MSRAKGPASAGLGLADDVRAETRPSGRKSTIDAWLESLTDAQRAEALDVLLGDVREYQHSAVARALRKRGLHTNEHQVCHWRRINEDRR